MRELQIDAELILMETEVNSTCNECPYMETIVERYEIGDEVQTELDEICTAQYPDQCYRVQSKIQDIKCFIQDNEEFKYLY